MTTENNEELNTTVSEDPYDVLERLMGTTESTAEKSEYRDFKANLISYHPHQDHYGGCPHCQDYSGDKLIGETLWIHCDEHKTKWCYGTNPFTINKDDTEEDWRKNFEFLADYEEVKSVYHKDDEGGPYRPYNFILGRTNPCDFLSRVSDIKDKLNDENTDYIEHCHNQLDQLFEKKGVGDTAMVVALMEYLNG